MGGRMERIRREVGSGRAVSPVVGVMLMLVVAVVLAAVVNSFAGGLAGTQEKAPAAAFETTIYKSPAPYLGCEMVEIKYLSGEPLDTSKLKIVFEHEGNVTEVLPDHHRVNYENNLTSLGGGSYWYKNMSTPYLYDFKYGGFETLGASHDSYNSTTHDFSDEKYVEFGNYVLYPGQSMVAQLYPTVNTTDPNVDQIEAIISDWQWVEPGDTITITIVDLRSNKPIYTEEVVVK